jgi:hypothetical protein
MYLDAVYPTINIVSIDTYEQEQMEKTKKSTKSCRKYLYIKAPESQIGLSYEENEDLEEASQASF